MDFTTANASAIKSIRQRDLLNAWMRLFAQTRKLPRLEHYRPDRFQEELPDIFVCGVQYRDGHPRIVIAADSMRMHPAFGPSGIGQTLDDYMGPKMAPVVVPLYLECIRLQRPVYTISKLADRDGRPVEYERLLMPFSDCNRVTSVVASLKAISEHGQFEVTDLMRNDKSPPVFALKAVIDSGTAPDKPNRFAPAIELEFD